MRKSDSQGARISPPTDSDLASCRRDSTPSLLRNCLKDLTMSVNSRTYDCFSSRLTLILVASVVASAVPSPPVWSQDPTHETSHETKSVTPPNPKQQRFNAFSEKLSGSIWKGRFSIDGESGELHEESYKIASVKKLPTGDLWLFKARIKYGDHDVTVPVPLKVTWGGKTPIIVVDHVTIPGLGTFDAHVLISGNRYAGTWQHGDVGGHLFGIVEKSLSP